MKVKVYPNLFITYSYGALFLVILGYLYWIGWDRCFLTYMEIKDLLWLIEAIFPLLEADIFLDLEDPRNVYYSNTLTLMLQKDSPKCYGVEETLALQLPLSN